MDGRAEGTDRGGDPARAIVAITRADLHGDPGARLAALAEVRTWSGPVPPTVDELAAVASDAVALLCVATDPLREPLFERLPALRLVALASVGYDSVDVAAAARRGIVVTNTPGVLNEAVADTAFGLILAARRRLAEADRYVRAGRWTESSLTLMVGLDVHGATLGLIGYGGIGRAVARRAAGFGMTVLAYDPVAADDGSVRRVALDDLLRESDVVSVHVPLSPATRDLIGERELRAMKPTATFVNTARGAVVDESALVRALREGWIGSAGIDVQAVEPNPDPGDPLLALPNCVVLPHIGSASFAARIALVARAVENVESFLRGGPPLTPVPVPGGGSVSPPAAPAPPAGSAGGSVR